ncbi:methyl-accepting chemotaxis protein [Rubrivivax sp. RP6-9]|uniref:methyl-accepting chemotaxis protein n=1 Tax=Rubrivivax sp. RP6-9 TaxID=3415750 RepID=UPI003CC5C8C2
MKFHTRLLLCAIVPAVLFILALSASVWGLVRTQNEFNRYIGTVQAVANGMNEMYAQGLQMGQALRNIVLDPANGRAYDNFTTAEQAYQDAWSGTSRLVQGTPQQAALDEMRTLREAQAVQQKKVLELARSDAAQAAALLNTGETPAWRALRAKLLEQMASSRKAATEMQAQTQARAQRVTVAAALLAVAAVVVSGLLCWLMRRTVERELGGDPALAGAALRRLADGDLSLPATGLAPAQGLMGELQRTQERLRALVASVRSSTDGIHLASSEIATGNQDLSSRTEQTASNLQRAAASMEQLTGTVQQSAESARAANQLASSAASVANRGGAVVSQVVATMDEITASSKKIADITGVIDGIAFQTNILALNAAVESARAGEQGRGFAVVAAEVRTLAQRSAEAAREIKGLIGASVDKVEAGSRLVGEAGATMQDIVQSVKQVSDIIGEITAAAGEQSQGLGQINASVGELDAMTQQNAALVEQSSAAAESLRMQADQLAQVVSVFRLEAR